MSHELLGFVLLGVFFVAIFAGFPIVFTLMFLLLTVGYLALGDVDLLPGRPADRRTHEGAGPRRNPPVHLHGLSPGGGRTDGAIVPRPPPSAGVPCPGSLYVAVLVTATIFGIAAGTVGATVAVVGIMAAPAMLRAGYSPRLSAGAITAGGSLGILIPPSVMLVVMGPMMGVPVISSTPPRSVQASCWRGSSPDGRSSAALIDPRLGPPLPSAERALPLGRPPASWIYCILLHVLLTAVTLGPYPGRHGHADRGGREWGWWALLIMAALLPNLDLDTIQERGDPDRPAVEHDVRRPSPRTSSARSSRVSARPRS